MKKISLFKEWLAKRPEDIFGFAPQHKIEKKTPFYEEQPIENLRSTLVLDDLFHLGMIGNKVPVKNWPNIVEYGNEAGGLHVSVSPLGSYKIIIRKFIKNEGGNLIPVCKSVIPLLNDYDHKGDNDPSEEILADDLYKKLVEIEKEPIDPVDNNYKGLEDLTLRLAQRIRLEHPSIMTYGGIIKLQENVYLIYMNYRGFGNGVPNNQKAESFNIYMQYKPNKGLIHSWGCEVTSPSRTRLYMSTPSEWDELFSPRQKPEEIIDCLMKIFMTY